MKKYICLFLICCMFFPMMQLNASEALTISGSLSSSFAIKPDGSLWAWGHNAYGQLGDGTTISRAYPVWVMDEVTAVTASLGRGHAAAIRTDGTLWAWGTNLHRELGADTTMMIDYFGNAVENSDNHIPVKVMDNVVKASAGWGHVAAIRTDGSLWVWGWKSEHIRFDGTSWYHPANLIDDGGRHSPVRIMDDVIAVSAGTHYTMAIRSDGSLWAWGNHDFGYIGARSLAPEKIIENVAAVSSGPVHTMIVKADGSLWAWGRNSSGQIGDGTITTYEHFGIYTFVIEDNARYNPVRIMDNVASVSAGRHHSMAIRTDGSLWAWGDNQTGRFGDGTNDDRHVPIRVMEDIAAVSAGYNHTLAIKNDGSLWVWGSNWVGELGEESLGFFGSNTPYMLMDRVLLPGNIEPVAVISASEMLPPQIGVKLNGAQVELDIAPIIVNDRTMVPFRGIFEALGMDVEWDADTQTAIGARENLRIELSIGTYTAYVNGEALALDAPAIIQDGRTMVPVRFIAEASGADVEWYAPTQTVIISIN